MKDALCVCGFCGEKMTWGEYQVHVEACRKKHQGMRWLPALLCLLLLSCGSGQGPAPIPIDNAETLHWTQEPLYADNTPLDVRSILLYEVHISDNADWSDNTLRAALAGVNSVGEPVSAFDLGLLAAYGIGPGAGCYVTVRSISFDNVPSGYGIPCWWEEP